MERGLLSSPDLKPLYDKVIWLYLFQDFSHSATDRKAERVAVRFGISSWPQHFLIDPSNLNVLGSTGRQLDSFTKAVQKARISKQIQPSQDELKRADILAAKIGRSKGIQLAKKHLSDNDIVVRFRAIEKLAASKPQLVVAKAAELLAVNHDQTRFLVCKILATNGTSQVAPSLRQLLKDPGQSKNPNVVRCRAAQALARCGDADALKELEVHLVVANPLNSLTRYCLEALKAIVKRNPKSKSMAKSILQKSFPKLPTSKNGTDNSRRQRPYIQLAKQVHGLLIEYSGRKPTFPKHYDAASRDKLIATWKKIVP